MSKYDLPEHLSWEETRKDCFDIVSVFGVSAVILSCTGGVVYIMASIIHAIMSIFT